MSRSTRMFDIIQLLRSAARPFTAHEIAQELEVTKRTIYRDIVALQAARVPIEGEAGIGYIMRPGFDLPPLMFTEDELEAISVGMALLGRTADSALQSTASSVTQKISEVLPAQDKHSLVNASLFASSWHNIPETKVEMQLLRQNIREQTKIVINYQDEAGTQTDRTILPLALMYCIEVVILAAWCELRQDFRHFRIDRILCCSASNNSFSDTGAALRTLWNSERNLDQLGAATLKNATHKNVTFKSGRALSEVSE